MIDEEKELYQRIKAGDSRAALELVAANCEKIWPIAKSMAREGEKWTPADLYQEAAVAMVRFAERWEWREGIPFFAACRMRVRGAMKDFLRRKANAVRNSQGQALSLDVSAGDGQDGPTMGERMASDDQEPGTGYELPETLSKQERAVLELRVFTEPPLRLATAAQALGWKPERVQQVQRRAMVKLRASA